jgi:NADPH2:quinone reductase
MKQRQIIIRKLGGPSVLKLEATEIGQPGPNDALVRVCYAGVSFADVLMREGVYIGMPELPFTPGYDIIGVVEKTGKNVTLVTKGDRVGALTKTGGYSQYITLDEKELAVVPREVKLPEAACLILNYVTAWQMLHRHVTVTPGQSMFVPGAGGGVGTALLELGKLSGLQMFGTASVEKAAIVRRLGATAIDYKNEDVVQRMNELVPEGVDFTFDGIGATVRSSYRTINRNGTLVLYGISSMLRQGRKDPLSVLKTYLGFSLLLRNIVPFGKRVSLYQITAYKRKHPDRFREDLSFLFNLLKNGKIKPHISSILPLREAQHAHELLNNSKVAGKIILDCNID